MNAIPVELLAKIADAQAKLSHRVLPSPVDRITLPAGWRVIERNEDGFYARNDARKIIVGCSEAIQDDGRPWRHVSASLRKRVPNYEEMGLVKRIFIGDDREAYAVWPRKSHHVNLHPYCLHLWCPLDGPVLPDFSFGGLSI